MAFEVCPHFLKQIANLAIGKSELRNEELGDSCPDVGLTIIIPYFSHVTSDELGKILITRTNDIGYRSERECSENKNFCVSGR